MSSPITGNCNLNIYQIGPASGGTDELIKSLGNKKGEEILGETIKLLRNRQLHPCDRFAIEEIRFETLCWLGRWESAESALETLQRYDDFKTRIELAAINLKIQKLQANLGDNLQEISQDLESLKGLLKALQPTYLDDDITLGKCEFYLGIYYLMNWNNTLSPVPNFDKAIEFFNRSGRTFYATEAALYKAVALARDNRKKEALDFLVTLFNDCHSFKIGHYLYFSAMVEIYSLNKHSLDYRETTCFKNALRQVINEFRRLEMAGFEIPKEQLIKFLKLESSFAKK